MLRRIAISGHTACKPSGIKHLLANICPARKPPMRNTASENKLDIRSFSVANSPNPASFSLSQLIPARIDGTEFIFDGKCNIFSTRMCASLHLVSPHTQD